MEAKDTVVPVSSHSESIYCPHCGEEFGIEGKVQYERDLQAEISFEAGIKAIRREIDQDLLKLWSMSSDNIYSFGNKVFEWWQAKLKEWG